jgi:L-seryl-tRNA(Ser) seleniumtransferase
MKPDVRRSIPAVNKVLEALDQVDLPRPVVVNLVRRELGALRETDQLITFDQVLEHVVAALHQHARARIQPVINGTGVILHTNFGRAPLHSRVCEAVARIASGYSNVEYDLATGGRGERAAYLEASLAVLFRAESATVVNNCAAALVLIARHFTAKRREIIISRGELVQIGGGFRIGEILEASGASLREVGSTNKTTLRDYARAIGPDSAMILQVHRSNFFMEGFVGCPATAELAGLARKRRLPFVVDLGSGLLHRLPELDQPEPTPMETLRHGADLVCFSGDKLFGGSQAGIIAGKTRAIKALKRHPLFRALRCDKLTLAALQETVELHLSNAANEIPALALIKTDKDELRARAANIITRLRGLPARISVGRSAVKSGGGTSPRAIIPSVTIDIDPENCSPNEFAEGLRKQTPPVIGYISDGSFKLDLRTIFPGQDNLIVDAIRSGCAGT